MKTYDIELHGVQSADADIDDRKLSWLVEHALRQHDLHVNSVKVTERDH